MQRHGVKRNTKLARKTRVGRGGTRGKTAGRGHKGQRARAGTGVRPEMRDVIKRLPKLRGRGVNSNKSIKPKVQSVNLATISEVFEDKQIVNPKSLHKKQLIKKVSGKLPVVKVLGHGDLSKKVIIAGCLISAPAREKIEKAGGKVLENKKR
jgi:large subunit ribosomal protein L15